MAGITFENVTFTYPGVSVPALAGVSLTVPDGAFLCLCGPSGSGKTTLLRQLVPAIAPAGELSGRILFTGRTASGEAPRVGFVGQDPENQIVTDTVAHELSFGLENLGLDPAVMERKMAETAAFFGIDSWYDRRTDTLSGGQKQLLALAACLAADPEVLLLDEPTAQLDPVAASTFLQTVAKINRDMGITVIMTEHRLEEVLPLASHLAVLEEGKILGHGAPASVGRELIEKKHVMGRAMPAALRVRGMTDTAVAGNMEGSWPLDVRSGRRYLDELLSDRDLSVTVLPEEPEEKGTEALKAADVWFRYERNEDDVLKGLTITARKGGLFAVMGGNGSGKTTLLSLLTGARKPYRGNVRTGGKVGAVPQDPTLLFGSTSVAKELGDGETAVVIAGRLGLDGLLERHPYDLSGGEQQRLALAKALLADPDILLLDEPTKGLDRGAKEELAAILKDLCEEGKTVLMVSHDIDFCSLYADRCALLFDGRLTGEDKPRRFFGGNAFYTTAASRMSRHLFREAVTAEAVAELCLLNLGVDPEPPAGDEPDETSGGNEPETEPTAGPGSFSEETLVIAEIRPGAVAPKTEKGSVKYRVVSVAALLLAAGAVVLGAKLPGTYTFYPISVTVVLLMLVPFFMEFEYKRPRARELVVLTVFITLGVVGRGIFFLTPQIKPVLAIAILAGASMGAGSGFLTGAMIAFLSNFLFGQGPWTPWQMLALGLVGFLAGILFCRRDADGEWIRPKAVSMMIYGFLSAYLYGLIVDAWTIFVVSPVPTWQSALTVYGTAFLFNTVLAVSTALFLWLLAGPMMEKMERMRTKYGLMEGRPKTMPV